MAAPDGSLFFDTRIGVDTVNIKKTIKSSFERINKAVEDKLKFNVGMDTTEADTKLAELERQYAEKLARIEQLKQQTYTTDDNAVSPALQAEIDKAEGLKLKIKEAKEAVATYREAWYQGKGGADAEHSKAITALRQLEGEYDTVCEKIDNMLAKEDILHEKEREKFESNRLKELEKEQLALDKLKTKINDYKQNVKKASIEGDQAVSVFGTLQKRIVGLAKRVFIFSVITAALRKIRQLFAEYAKEDDAFSTSLGQIKGNLLIAFQILYEKIMPILTLIMQVVARITDQVAKFMAVLAGKDYEQVKKNAKALYEQAKATNATGKAAKKAKRELAGFDKLNKLGDSDSSSDKKDKTEPKFDYADSTDKATKMKIDNILKYTAILMGFAMVIIGIFTFNIPLIIAGGLLLAWGLTMASTTETPTWVDMVISWGLMIVGVAMLLIGIFTGNLALIIAGVLAIAVGFTYGNASSSFAQAPMWVNQIITYGLMVIGVVMLIVGIASANIPLLVAGIALLGVGIAYGAKTGVFTALWKQLKKLKDDIVTLVKTFFAWVSEKWAGFKEKAAKAMDWLKKHLTLKNLFNGYIGYLEWMINIVVKGINTLTGLLSKLKFKVPKWVPEIGGKSIGFDIPKVKNVTLPRLATGTVVPANYGEFLSILGDNKREPEIVSPVSTMKRAVREVMSEMGFEVVVENHMYLDGDEMTDTVIKKHNQIVKRTGKTPLKGV